MPAYAFAGLALAGFSAFGVVRAPLAQNSPAWIDSALADDPLEREWWVRAVARSPEDHVAEVLRALEAQRWRARAVALDALERAAESECALAPELLAAARRALGDAHPNVRARALAVLAAVEAELSAVELEALLTDPLASLRHALACALEFSPAPGRSAALLQLGLDPDERVRESARNALCALEADEEGVTAARLALLGSATRETPEAFARFLLRLAHAPFESRASEAPWFEHARTAVAHTGPARRALLEALAFVRLGGGAGGGAGGGVVETLVAGATSAEVWESTPARLMLLAARAQSEGLAHGLLGRLEASALDGLALDGVVRRGMVELLLESCGSTALPFLVREAPAPALLSELITAHGLRSDDHWSASECAAWTVAPTPSEVRRALLDVLADGFSRSADEGRAALLARFLEDPQAELRSRAFEALCSGRARSTSIEQALHAAWGALDEGQRRARLAWFSREEPFPSFRSEWIELGDDLGTRAVACELLAGFGGDAGVRSQLERWLQSDSESLTALRQEAPRALEQRLQGELRALARVSDGSALEAFEALLLASLGVSTEVGKVAVAALGRSAAGASVLESYLASDALASPTDRRTRIEASIVLARDGRPAARVRACALLVQDRTGASWELRERMLRALAAAGTEAALEELCRLALDPEIEPVERAALATLLGGFLETPHAARAREVLRSLVRAASDLEARRVALRALVELGDGAGVGALFDELGLAEAQGEERALLRGEFLVALARLPAPPESLCREWLEAPLARAAADLEQRFAGAELAATEFTWRNELVLAGLLAQAGRVQECLARSVHWERLDGRLLVLLGEALEQQFAREAADQCLAAGIVALLGDRDPDRALLARARALRLALAWRRERWRCAALLAQRTLSARRDGQLSESEWSRLFGSFERAAGIDPEGRVRAARWQAAARLALDQGELESARAASARAARECGASSLARGVQLELERALARAVSGEFEAR